MKNMKMLMGALAGLLMTGCAGHRTVMGERTLVERIPAGGRPKWVGEASPNFGDGNHYFHGSADAREDMQLCIREAQAGAEKTLAGMLMQQFNSQFDLAMKGENKHGGLGTAVGDYFGKKTANVQVSGSRIAKQFVEVMRESERARVRYSYDCHVLVSLSKADYEEARQGVFDGLRGKVKAELNRDAQDTFERVMEKLERPSASESSGGR